MIKLFDSFTPETCDLYYSLETTGFNGVTVVINDDGCLPKNVTSPYSYFCGMENGTGKAKYFNQVVVPDFWQITGTNTQGEIWQFGMKKATIYYHEPKHLRLVRAVDWLSDKQKVYRTDHYNQYGWIYARTYFDHNERMIYKKYFNQEGQEIIVENTLAGLIFLYWKGKVHSFEQRSQFFLFYFNEARLDTTAIWYNSLSTPFVISYYSDKSGEDVLFWQEPIYDSVPGNMQLILSGAAKRTKKIVVQDKKAYDKLLSLIPAEKHHMITYLGYMYPERQLNSNTKQILILTNSDTLEGLDILVSQLSDYHFHIAALTEMSQKLMAYGDHDNVTLYPNVASRQVDKLLETCDIYFDINHGSEILNAVRQAFEYNLVITAFQNTAHQPSLLLPETLFSSDNPENMVKWLKEQTDLQHTVNKQRRETGQETIERYQSVLN